MPLRDLVSGGLAVKQLVASLRNGRLAHAYLFSGPAGSKKEEAVKAFAQALNCECPIAGDACGKCLSCRKIAGDNHSNLLIVEPQRSHIRIEQIRELQRKLYLQQLEGKNRVAVVLEADLLTEAAANSLLKVLEEPPINSTFVLVTNRPAAILATIRSRCQQVRFATFDDENKMTDGNPAVWQAADLKTPEAREDALTYLEQLTQADRATALALAAELEKREDLDLLLDWMARWYRDIIVWQQLQSETLVLNRDQMKRVRSLPALARNADSTLLSILRTRQRLLENSNTRLSLEVLLIRLTPDGTG